MGGRYCRCFLNVSMRTGFLQGVDKIIGDALFRKQADKGLKILSHPRNINGSAIYPLPSEAHRLEKHLPGKIRDLAAGAQVSKSDIRVSEKGFCILHIVVAADDEQRRLLPGPEVVQNVLDYGKDSFACPCILPRLRTGANLQHEDRLPYCRTVMGRLNTDREIREGIMSAEGMVEESE